MNSKTKSTPIANNLRIELDDLAEDNRKLKQLNEQLKVCGNCAHFTHFCTKHIQIANGNDKNCADWEIFSRQ